MKAKINFIGIIVLGLILLGMPPLYAQDEDRSALDSANEAVAEIAANRDVVMDGIVNSWSGEAEGWEEQFSLNVSQADDSKLLALENAASFDEVIDILNGDTPEVLGDSTRDLVYTPVTPCKIIDTRFGGGGFIFAGQTRNYQTYGSLGFQGGSICSSPRGEPSAVHLSIVAITPNGQGNLKTNPYLTGSSNGIAVNFAPIGTNLANAGTTGVRRFSSFDISISANNAGAHVSVQVLGYYYPGNPSLNEAAFSGYDYQNTTITSTGYQFVYPNSQSPNTTQISLSSSDRVLVMTTMTIHRSGGIFNDVKGTVTPCYATTGNSIVERGNQEGGFQGETDFDIESSGSGDRVSMQTSYLFRSVPSGTYRFGICASRASSLGTSPANYVVGAPKVVVIKLRP